MPITLTETLNNLYTTTWELRKGKAHDNIFTATPFWFWMKEKGRFRTESGGRFLMEPIEYDKNTDLSWVTKGDAVSLNDYEFLTESKWDWKYLVASLVRFGIDDQQNRGKARIISLMNAKLNNTENSLVDTLETRLFGTVSGDSILGLQRLVPDDPTASQAVGGLNPSAGNQTYWRNQKHTLTGVSFSVSGVAEMRTMLNECMTNRTSDKPDIILTAQTPYEYYEDETMEQKQIVNKKLGDAGFTNIEFKGIPMVWSPACASSRMYFLNTNFLHFIYDPMLNFDMTEWKAIPDQVNDRAAQIILACMFIVTRRLCQGIIYAIDTA